MVQAVALLENSDSDIVHVPKSRSARRMVGQVLGGVVLLLSGVAIGRQHPPASLRGTTLSLIGEAAISSRAQFEAAYHAYTDSMAPALLSAANTVIYTTDAPLGPSELVALHTWYQAVSADDKTWANHMTNQAFVKVAMPTAPAAVPATKAAPSQKSCRTQISSYTDFGHCYSQATAGRPWARIAQVDEQVRAAILAENSSAEISVLWSWYKQHASASEKHDFEKNALVHTKSAGGLA